MIRVFYPEIFKGHPKQEAALSLARKIYEFSEFLHLQGLLSRNKEKLKTIHLAEILASF